MIESRVAALKTHMRAKGIALTLVDGPESVSYLSGYMPTTTYYQGLVLPMEGPPMLVVRSNDRDRAVREARGAEIVAYRDWDEPLKTLAERLASSEGILGKDMASMAMTQQRLSWLHGRIEPSRWVDISPHLEELRGVKAPEEIELHRRAARLADEAIAVGIEAVLGGARIEEAGLAAHVTARQGGADDRRTVVARGGKRPPEHVGAELAMIELVPAVAGYDARLIRTVAVGVPSEAQRRVAERVIEIQDAQIAAMVPGAVASHVDELCRRALLDEGLRPDYDGLTGHGLGLTWNGRTTDTHLAFTPEALWELRPGMLFHMYTRAQGFVIGDTVLVTASGPHRLTTIGRALFAAEGQ